MGANPVRSTKTEVIDSEVSARPQKGQRPDALVEEEMQVVGVKATKRYLSGFIAVAGELLAGAHVSLKGYGLEDSSTTTDARGRFGFVFDEYKEYRTCRLVVEAEGFERLYARIEITGGEAKVISSEVVKEEGASVEGERCAVRVRIEPEDASVYLDGRFLGTGKDLKQMGGVPVEKGVSHRVVVVRPGYRFVEITLSEEACKDTPRLISLQAQ